MIFDLAIHDDAVRLETTDRADADPWGEHLGHDGRNRTCVEREQDGEAKLAEGREAFVR